MSDDTKDNAEKQKYTEGPWCWQSFDGGKTLFLGTPDRGRLVVMDFVRQGFNSATARFAVRSPGMGGLLYPVTESNVLEFPDARLIAAAPDLLAALRELMRSWDSTQYKVTDRIQEALDDAEAAIAKAEGGAS